MAKEVVFKVADFVTPIKTGNAVGVIYSIDEEWIKVLTLDLDGMPNGESKRYREDQLMKTPRKYRIGYWTAKSIIKAFDKL